jgi:hypothetical protein
LEFSELNEFMSTENKNKDTLSEITKHVNTCANALYQLFAYLAKLIIVGGKVLFDSLYEIAVKPADKEQELK